MITAWSVDRVRAAEESAMARLPEGELMQRAASGLADIVAARVEERDARAVVALVGPGNNGGDALYAVARLAADDLQVTAVHTGRVHPGAWEAAVRSGVLMVDGAGPDAAGHIRDAGVVVDGVLGIGGRPGLPDWARPWVEAIRDDALVVAVDLPSGQDPAGRVATAQAVFADETVTFGVLKPVHLLPATEAACGRLTTVDIGLDLHDDPDVVRITRDDVAELWPVPGPTDDKYSRGVLGVIAGGELYTGAALMSVMAAVRSGVGMVRYVGTPTPHALLRAAVPEAVHGVGRVQAWVVGPGLDVRDRHDGAVAQLGAARDALASQTPVLVDAGGLDLVSGRRATPTLLTPHAGELARLLTRLRRHGGEVTPVDVEADPVGAAQEAADLTGSTVLLKGSTTLVVSPSTSGTGPLPVFSQAEAPAWLATAGAGDVLAGLAGALLAAGLPPHRAGALAALVHGVAAHGANPGGPVHATAVAQALPATVAALLRRD